MAIKYLVLFIAFEFCFVTSGFAESKFLISKKTTKNKRMSKNKLKENIGQEFKNVLDSCVQASRQLGILQIKLSEVQSHVLPKVETLINNNKPFKKASRDQLHETLKLTQNITLQIKNQISVINSIKSKIDKDGRLK